MKASDGTTGIVALFTMWRHTRLVVMTSVIAAVHAAALIPFKPIPILPGVTEVRPGMALPIVFSLMFGPAAAWGAALGNTIGDLFGTLGPGTLFGFVGNLLYGYLPWRIWQAWRGSEPRFRSRGDWAVFVLATAAASGACALVIGWGIHLLGLFHFVTTAGIILANNSLVCLVLGPPLLIALHPRVARMDLLYPDLAGEGRGIGTRSTGRARFLRRAASAGSAASALGGIAAGYIVWVSGQPDAVVTATTTPFVIATLLMCALV